MLEDDAAPVSVLLGVLVAPVALWEVAVPLLLVVLDCWLALWSGLAGVELALGLALDALDCGLALSV